MATLATVGDGRGWLGAVVARQAAGRNGWCASTAVFLPLHFKPQLACYHNMTFITCVGAEEMRAVLAARLGASDVPRPYDTAAE